MERIGSILERTWKSEKVAEKTLLFELRAAWESLLDGLSGQCEPKTFSQGRLTVFCESSAVASEVPLYMDRIQEFAEKLDLPRVNALWVRVHREKRKSWSGRT